MFGKNKQLLVQKLFIIISKKMFIRYDFLMIKVEDNDVFYYNLIFLGTIRCKILGYFVAVFNIRCNKKRSELATFHTLERNRENEKLYTYIYVFFAVYNFLSI